MRRALSKILPEKSKTASGSSSIATRMVSAAAVIAATGVFSSWEAATTKSWRVRSACTRSVISSRWSTITSSLLRRVPTHLHDPARQSLGQALGSGSTPGRLLNYLADRRRYRRSRLGDPLAEKLGGGRVRIHGPVRPDRHDPDRQRGEEFCLELIPDLKSSAVDLEALDPAPVASRARCGGAGPAIRSTRWPRRADRHPIQDHGGRARRAEKPATSHR